MKELQTLSLREARQLLNLGRCTCYRLVHTGRLPVIRVGRQYRVPTEALRRMLAEADAPCATELDPKGGKE